MLPNVTCNLESF